MALRTQFNFSGGEIDPALQERTTLSSYSAGLKTARNTTVSKTGRLISRAGRKHFVAGKLANRKFKIHVMSHIDVILEWGHLYVRAYESDGSLFKDLAHSFTEDDLDFIQFVEVNFEEVLILKEGSTPLRLQVNLAVDVQFLTVATSVPVAPTLIGETASVAGTGYAVEYLYTYVKDGEESFPLVGPGTLSLPINALEHNTLEIQCTASGSLDNYTEIRVYRRPTNGGEYGFIGTGFTFKSGAAVRGKLKDVGQAADFTHFVPSLNAVSADRASDSPGALLSKAGVVYQDRLILNDFEAIAASRTKFPYNLYRDHPLSTDSALAFKAGSSGFAYVLFMVEADSLIIFTTKGIFSSNGPLSPTNLALTKRGGWVVDEEVAPLNVGGEIFFIDRLTNTVRQLLFSEENGTYNANEVSIFSDHLFKGAKIKSWAFEEGDTPLLWVIFSDGTAASFSYEKAHNMRAWTRHDSVVDLEYVASTGLRVNLFGAGGTNPTFGLPRTYFVVNNSGTRAIEHNVPRYVSTSIASADTESDKNESIAAMDSMVSYSTLVNDSIVDDDMTITPITPGDFEGLLTLAVVDDAIFPDPGIGAVGTRFRHFDPTDKTAVDLVVTARASDNSITVQPSALFPSANATNPRLYVTATVFTGLTHLNGESVSVVADGYVIGSPNNDIQNYTTLTPSAGSLTLPDPYAIVHIGRPYTADIETLDVNSVEQRPVLIESKIVDKLYVKTHETRELYVGPTFPENDKVAGMEELDSFDVDTTDTIPIIGNRYDQPKTKRTELTIPGDWKSQGRVAMRSVDPIHFEILSVMPDLDDQRR